MSATDQEWTRVPVIRTSEKSMGIGNRPEWSRVTRCGLFRVTRDGGRFDCHYHDCHEYWLVFKGKAKVMTEGDEYYVKPGDIVCTKAGDEHDVLEVYEDLAAFFIEDDTPEGGRVGHLHRSEAKAARHSVIVRPVPEDFPR